MTDDTAQLDDDMEILRQIQSLPPIPQKHVLGYMEFLLQEQKAKAAKEQSNNIRVVDKTSAGKQKEDPIIALCDQWKAARHALFEGDDVFATDEAPEFDEIHAQTEELLNKILKMSPSTPKGLAAFMDVFWLDWVGGTDHVGSTHWKEQMNCHEGRFIRRARHAAHFIVANAEKSAKAFPA